jgi:electron transfer flavoprotein alpha subunit
MRTVTIALSDHETAELEGFAFELDADVENIICTSDYLISNPEAYINQLIRQLARINPDAVIFPELPEFSGIAPFIAHKLSMDCVTSVSKILKNGSSLSLLRSVISGKATSERALRLPSVITIMPGCFKKPDGNIATLKQRCELAISEPSKRRIKNLGIFQEEASPKNSAITQAKILVSAGRGIGSPENLKVLDELAGLFSSSAIAGSRSVIDAGWLPYSSQVGLTGKTVEPDLYIACGISGSPQHIAGMKGSRLIAAINIDPDAAIFNHSHICIVEDLFDFIPQLIDEIKKLKKK